MIILIAIIIVLRNKMTSPPLTARFVILRDIKPYRNATFNMIKFLKNMIDLKLQYVGMEKRRGEAELHSHN
jgi:hypothetical protein